MTATYFRHGERRSLAAREAEADERMPLTRAAQAVRRETGCTLVVARDALRRTHDGEWHHVGKYAARCDYYSVSAACRLLALADSIARLPADWREALEPVFASPSIDERGAARDAAFAVLGERSGLSAEDASWLYYEVK